MIDVLWTFRELVTIEPHRLSRNQKLSAHASKMELEKERDDQMENRPEFKEPKVTTITENFV